MNGEGGIRTLDSGITASQAGLYAFIAEQPTRKERERAWLHAIAKAGTASRKTNGAQARETKVYAISRDDAVKIGVADDVYKRLASLQTASADELRLVGWISAPLGLERFLHKTLAKDRLRGEWFTITPVVRALLAFVGQWWTLEESNRLP